MNWLKMLGAGLVVAAAWGGPTQACSFRVLRVEGPGATSTIPGFGAMHPGFTTSFGGFYNRSTTDPLPTDPTAWAESSTNHVAYDSYVTLSGFGPYRLSVVDDVGDSLSPQIRAFYGDAYSDTHIPQCTDALFDPGWHIGDDPQDPDVEPLGRAELSWGDRNRPASYVNPVNDREGMFIAQLTTNRGATLSGAVRVQLTPAPDRSVFVSLTLNGPAVSAEYVPGITLAFALRSYLVATNDNLSNSRSGGNMGAGSGSSQRFGPADVHHVWIEATSMTPPLRGDSNGDLKVTFDDVTTTLASLGAVLTP